MKESHLIKILKFGLYVAALIPLVIFKDFISPFHFGKIIVFRSLIEVLFAFYLVLAWHDRSYLPKRDSIFWSLAIFTGVFGLTSLFSIQPYESFWGTLERMGGFWSFIHYFIFFVILNSVFRTKGDWLKFLNVTIFVGLLSAFYGFGQKTDIEFFIGSGNRARIFGTIGNAALFAGYELGIAFLSLMFLTRKNNTRNQVIFYGFAFLISTIAVLMTATRGSLLGLALGIFVFSVFYVWIYESRWAKNLILAFVTIFMIFFLVSIFLRDSEFIKNSRYLTKITDISFKSYTVQTRFWAWEAGLRAWDDSPKTMILGWGPENFNIPFSMNFNPNFFQGPGSETFFDRAHNMFIEILITMGIVGLVAYLGIFGSLFRSLWIKLRKIPKEEAIYYIGIISLLVANIAHTTFFFDITANFVLFFIIVAFASFLSSESIGDHQKDLRSNNKNLTGLGALGLLVLLILAFWLTAAINIKPARANYATTRGIVRGWSGDFKGAAEKFIEALSYGGLGAYEYRHRFAQFIFENSSKLDDSVVQLAIDEVLKNVESHPNDYLPLLYLSRLNILLGKNDPNSPYNDKALDYSLQALKLSPTFVRTYYEIGQVYLNKKEFDKAIEAFRKAAELNPEVGISYWYWGIIEADRGNVQLAIELIEKAFNAKIPFSASDADYQRLLAFYSKYNNYRGLIRVLESLVNRHPTNPDFHAKLAGSYARAGQIENAIKHAKIAAGLDSKFESEARAFVQSIGGTW